MKALTFIPYPSPPIPGLLNYGLALHTSSPDLGLAINNFAGDSRSQVWNLGRAVSSHLHVYLAEFLQPQTWADVAFVAVAQGPGGFTGTRIGVVTARTIAQQLDIPLFAISTFAALAWAERGQAHAIIAVQMQAQRGQVFGAIYQVGERGVRSLLADSAMSSEVWQQTLQDWATPYDLILAEEGLGTSVTSVLDLAHQDWQQGLRPHWSEALPFYGQHPVIT